MFKRRGEEKKINKKFTFKSRIGEVIHVGKCFNNKICKIQNRWCFVVVCCTIYQSQTIKKACKVFFFLSTEFDYHARNFSHFKVHHHSTRSWNRNFFSLENWIKQQKKKIRKINVKIYVTQKMHRTNSSKQAKRVMK